MSLDKKKIYRNYDEISIFWTAQQLLLLFLGSLDKNIEAHHINSTLDDFDQDKQEAKTPNEILSIIGKEQEFLSGLHNNIKYPEYHADIPDKCEIAYNQKEDNSLKDLKDIANQALNTGAKTEINLLKDLRQVTNLKAGSKTIGIDIENHEVSKTIDSFEITKDKKETPLPKLEH